MKSVSIDELKKNLSALITEAGRGQRIVITRHNRPVASLQPAEPDSVHVGERAGQKGLGPLPGASTHGRYLKVISEDRENPRDRP